ncbi:MAG: hypothetical protein M3Y27_02325 [Acidobacteriota bacterium]|nr:hypothetical protein [Acidobacteriota bacterium]
MFGIGKEKSKADAVIAVMPQAIEAASDKWRYFCDTLPFKAEVPLARRIASFTIPFFEGARQNIPALKDGGQHQAPARAAPRRHRPSASAR